MMRVRKPGEQEAAVAAGGPASNGAGVDADDTDPAVEQLADRGQARATEADHADVSGDVVVQRRQRRPAADVPDGRHASRETTRPNNSAASCGVISSAAAPA